MKFTCDRQALTEAVLNVQRAVSSKSSIPALEGILLKAKTDSLFLCGYDLALGMTTEIPASVEETGTIVLSARLFGDIVRRLPDSGVHIDTDDKNMTTITSGQSNFSIVGIPAEEYPELPTISGETGISLPNGVLKGMIRQTIFAGAESDAKPIQEISKLLPDNDETCTFQVGSRHILFSVGNYTVISRLLEGEFLDYRAAIPQTSTSEAVIKTQDFISSVERVSLLITERLKSPVRCIFDENEVRLSCYTPIGRASDSFPEQLTGPAVEMGFNDKYLLDALRNTEGDQVKIQLNGPLSPMKVLPSEGDSYLFLVLPVRLKSE